jgi:hypothetical protein
MKKILTGLALAGLLATQAQAAFVTPGFNLIVTQGEEGDLASGALNDDLIHLAIGTELPGDQGWHPANPASVNGSLDPNGLPTLTDGVINSGLAGLLNDFPPADAPTKRVQYDFGSPEDIGQINIITGNDGRDGRVFHSYTVEFSTDNGVNWSSPIYVQSHDSGTVNPGWRVVQSQLFDAGNLLASGATNVRLDFYGVDNTLNEMRDGFAGVNPFTGFDDGLTAPNTSPLLWEIDVFLPEPGSLVLLGFGGLALLRRRR